jgi:class 3 adenylate cyclase/CHASE2 domain-containing sensor protein
MTRDAVSLAALALLVAALALGLVRWFPPLSLADGLLADLAISRLSPPEPQDQDIVLVVITEDTLAALPYRSPLDRSLLAGLVEQARQAGARAVGLDVLVDQPTEPAKDEALHRALQAPATVTLAAGPETPLTPRQRAFHEGFLTGLTAAPGNLATERIDQTVRRHEPVIAGHPTLPAALAQAVGVLPPTRPFLIAWHGSPDAATRPFAVYPAHLLGLLPHAWLAGKIVLIGADLPDADRHRTPLSLGGRLTPGVEIQAHILAQILDHRPSPLAGPGVRAVLAIALAAAGVAVGALGLPLLAEAGVGVLVLALLWLGAGLAATQGEIVSPLVPSLAWAAGGGLTSMALRLREKQRRETLMRLFSAYVSEPVAREVWRARDVLLSGGRLRSREICATVLFSDIEGFTPISERMTPEALMAWLDDYLEAMTGVVLARDGVVLRFIGDGILAAFGVPVAAPGEEGIRAAARQAVSCTLDMANELARLNERWRARGLPEIRVRAGIVTGPMVAGSLGATRHQEYTLIGDAVNTAARLEALAKTAATGDGLVRILVAASTWQRVQDQFTARPVGEVALKGKEEKVTVYQILGHSSASAASDSRSRRVR